MHFSRKNRTRGAAVIELAITLPVFVLIVIGTIETTQMIFLQQSLEICAYQGARVALIPSSSLANVTGTCDKVLADRRIHGASVSITPTSFQSQPYGTMIEVRVTAPCSRNSAYSPWFYGGKSLTGSVTMMKEY